MVSLTPVLYVEKIEPSLAFWEKALGFERITEVPGEDGLGFVFLMKAEAGVMLQTFPSLEEDLPKLAAEIKGHPTFLYLRVDDLDEIIQGLEGFDVEVERRETFYGADEIGYREPGGHIAVFAQFKEE